jgi:Phage tail protein
VSLSVFQLSYQGLTIGDGTDFEIKTLDGLESLPDIVNPDVKVDRDQGLYAGTYTAGGRLIAIEYEVHAGTDAAFRADLDALGAALAPIALTEQPLAFLLPGMVQLGRQSYVRPLTRACVVDIDYTHRIARGVMHLFATDPRLYDVTLNSQTAGLPAGNGGLTWPTAWPISWGSAGAGGLLTCTNAGTFESRPVLTITGPIDNPTISNLTTGQSFTLAITLIGGDSLVIDMRAKTVVLNGTASRRGNATVANWWTIIPGNNSIQFSANTVQVGSQLTVAFASAWI